MLLDLDAASLALAPFGAGAEFLGVVSLLRKNLDKPWTGPEISAVESLAADIGRALEHARLYESKEQLVKELRSLDRAKTSFLASSSHDLRTPLTSIVGFIELLTDGEAGPVPPLQAQMHDAISRNARRLQTLISDMLTISKIELGSFTSHMRPVDLTALVPPAAEVLSTSAADKGLILEIDCPGHSLIVDGDAEQLDRVVVNLLSNAVKYTPRGGTVRLTAGRDGQFARLTVADTGIGIPEHDQRSVFTRFFRASNAVAQQIQGSGLGLSIVQTVVANHQGDVVLESQEGGGTTVVVTIPLLASPGRAGGPAR
jgi:signal transduction histidine kinase